MQEEISLRELIEVIIKGKKLIAAITVLALLIAALLNFFVIKPTYETKATILINSLQQEENSPLNAYLNEVVSPKVYSERLKSEELLRRVIESHKLDSWTISDLKSNLNIDAPQDSNILTLSLKGNNPELIHKTLKAILVEANSYIGETISARLSGLAEQYKEQLSLEKENLDTALKEYNAAKAAEGLPTIVLLDALTTGQKQYLLNVDEKYLEELQSMDKDKQVEFTKLNNKVNTLTELYTKYSKNYEEARSISKLYKVDNKLTILSAPEVPENPVAPNKVLNLGIAMIIGLMLSIVIVFVLHYWNKGSVNSLEK